MKKLCYLCSFVFFCITNSFSQKPVDASFKLDIYPTGLIPAIIVDKAVNEKSIVGIRFGYNWFRHRELGVHDDERGGGFGYTIGYKRYFSTDFQGWHLGVKADMWWNHVDWYDIGVNDDRITGETDITVLQPTAELGYLFLLANDVIVNPSVSFGWEWNIRTLGEPTGEGAIGLIGIKIGKRFN